MYGIAAKGGFGSRGPRKDHGFTLVELLVVIGIIAVLLGILLPSLALARAAAKQAVCLSNLHQVYTVMVAYAEDNHDVLPQRLYPWQGQNVDGVAQKDGSASWYGGFGLLVDGGYLKDVRVLYCPFDTVNSAEDSWPTNTAYDWYGYYTSYGQREEQAVDLYKLGEMPAQDALLSDWFVDATEAKYVMHGKQWNVAYFDGSVRPVLLTTDIWNTIAWSQDYTAQAVTWHKFDGQ